jgi:uncharacterized delta-60 repeat protein
MAGAAAVLVVTVGVPAGADPGVTAAGGGGRGPRAGTLDARFGTGGIVRTDYEGAPDGAGDVLVQPDGRVVAAGSWGRGTGNFGYPDFALARYDRSGRLDPTFGTAGRVATDFFGGYDTVNTVLRQRDGKLVAVGSAFPVSGSHPSFALARYLPDGRLDPTFGDGGTVTTDVGPHGVAASAALQPDGKIVIAGFVYTADGEHGDLVVARYLPDGTLDPAFGVAGIVVRLGAPGLAYLLAQDLAIQPDGRIVTVGLTASLPEGTNIAVTRFRPDGSLDPSFGDGGIATVDFSADEFENATALSLLPDGKIAVLARLEPSTWVLGRLRPDGRLDTGFGTGGIVRSHLDGEALDLLAQDDGRLVVAGRTAPTGTDFDVTLVRYRRDGRLDRSFGTGGVVTTDIAGSTDGAAAVTAGPHHTLVIAGTTDPIPSSSPYADLLVARYHA